MSITSQDIEKVLPKEYNIDEVGTCYQIYDGEGSGAKIKAGTEDGNNYLEVEDWEGEKDRIYEDSRVETSTFFKYEWVDQLFSEEDTDAGANAEVLLENGIRSAYDADSSETAAEYLINASTEAYEVLSEEELNITDLTFQSQKSKSLGNASITYGTSEDCGVQKIDLDMDGYSPEFATAAAYISGVVLLQDASNKPKVSTGYSYKPGATHHDAQKDQADIELVEAAQNIKEEFDFLN